MAKYPDRHSATLPALGAAQRVHGWCSPEAIQQVAAVMQVTPAYLSSVATFYDMLRTSPAGPLRLRLHERRLPPAQREGRLRRHRGGGARGLRGARVRVPRRLRHGADGVDRRSLRRPALTGRRARAGGRPQGGPPALPGPRAGGSRVTETRILLANIDEPDLHTLEVYERLGGYARAAQGAARDDPRGGAARARGVRPARPRRRRLLDGQEGLVHPQGHDGQVPLLQRRRVRAGRVQGPPADAEEPAPADRGLHHRRDRRGRQQGLHLHPRRVLVAGRHPRRGRAPRPTRRATSASASSARSTRSTSSSTAARAPTSAARRPACSTRSRASAATRASSRPSPPTRASTRGRR